MSRPTGSGGPARPPRPSGFLIGAGLVVLLVLACRIAIPFEDAFITLRCARNLAEHGEYTYNLGERNFAGSSHLYTLLAASAYLPGRAPAMWLISLGNSMASVLAAYCLALWFVGDPRLRRLVWVLTALSPPVVEMTYSGMETPIFLLLLSTAGFRAASRIGGRRRWTLTPMFLIPLVRPEAFAHGGLVWLASWWRKRRVDWGGGIALAAGVITAVIANLLVSGSVVPQTLAAKQLSPEAFSNIGHNLATLFIENSVFAPVTARSLNPIKPFLAPIVLGLLLWGLVRRRDHRPAWALALALAVVPTAAYAFGGVLFGWYWAPGKIAAVSGAFSAGAMLLSNALHGAGRRRVVRTLVLSGAVIAFCGQVVIGAVNRAIEADGRIEVGNWIREHSPPDATIVLEPAGFIPYYAERRTWDEVGLGSHQVLEARREHGEAWLVPFLRSHDVSLVVQRDAFARDRMTYHGYALTDPEREWFDANFDLVHTVTTDPGSSVRVLGGLVAWAKAGRVPSLYVYARRR